MITVTVRRTYPRGAWQCSAIVNGQLITRTYYGYTRPEAVEWFRHNVRCEWPRAQFGGVIIEH